MAVRMRKVLARPRGLSLSVSLFFTLLSVLLIYVSLTFVALLLLRGGEFVVSGSSGAWKL